MTLSRTRSGRRGNRPPHTHSHARRLRATAADAARAVSPPRPAQAFSCLLYSAARKSPEWAGTAGSPQRFEQALRDSDALLHAADAAMRVELLPFFGAKNATEKVVTSALDLGRFGATRVLRRGDLILEAVNRIVFSPHNQLHRDFASIHFSESCVVAVHSFATNNGDWALKAAAAARQLGPVLAPSERRLRVLVSIGAHYNYDQSEIVSGHLPRLAMTYAAIFCSVSCLLKQTVHQLHMAAVVFGEYARARVAAAAEEEKDRWQLAVLEVGSSLVVIHRIRNRPAEQR